MCADYRMNDDFAPLRLRVLALLFGLLAGLIGLVGVSTAGFAAAHAGSPSPGSPSQSVGVADIAAFRQVIDRQIEAFHRDDAEAAYGFASPEVKAIFPTPEAFMAMVRQGYQPVYRAERYRFEAVSVIDGRIIQPVRIAAADGAPVLAMYIVERQPDGAWKIGGCLLLKDSSQGI